ncbi:hypothetical protein ACWGZ8_08410 [Xanthomonas axonopodis pv. khayae]|nr:hypothetical protein [Xanthomonas citri pv. fuscans]
MVSLGVVAATGAAVRQPGDNAANKPRAALKRSAPSGIGSRSSDVLDHHDHS